MNQYDILIDLFKYFAQFVPKDVLKKSFVKPQKEELGYDQVRAEALNTPNDRAIEGIDSFVFSANEEFVSDQVKNSKGVVLYVEYGAFTYQPNTLHGVKEHIGITVAYPYSMKSSDNLNESLLMNRMHNILCSILDRMETDQSSLEFCGNKTLIDFPVNIVAITPELFHNRTGWTAVFENSLTNMI